MPVGASFGARMSKVGNNMATRVTRMSNTALGKSNTLMQRGLGGPSKGMKAHLGTAQAMAGRAGMSAARYSAQNPKKAMGIAAGVTGAGGMAANRRRGSQNYPMY